MLKIFNTTKQDGTMSFMKKYYPKDMTKEDIEKELLKRRIKIGIKNGFDGTKIIVPSLNNNLFSYGYIEDVTEELEERLEDNPYLDLWNLDIPCDIMIIRSSMKKIALAHLSDDWPVLIANAKDAFAIARCTAKDIDNDLPAMVVEALKQTTDAKSSEIEAYIGPSMGISNYPNWAHNKVWDNAIIEKDKKYLVSLKKAIMIELMNNEIKSVIASPVDTITNPDYYSNYAYNNGVEDKDGKFLVGAFYENKKLVKTK